MVKEKKQKKNTEVLINFEELKLKISCKNYNYNDFMRLVNKINEVINTERKEEK